MLYCAAPLIIETEVELISNVTLPSGNFLIISLITYAFITIAPGSTTLA